MRFDVFESGASDTPPSPPANPSIGYPSNGDPLTGEQPTVPGAYFFYALTEELRNLLLAVGITPSVDRNDQLAQAFRDIPDAIASSVLAQDISQHVSDAIEALDVPGMVDQAAGGIADVADQANETAGEAKGIAQNALDSVTAGLMDTVEGLVSDALDKGFADALGYTPARNEDLAVLSDAMGGKVEKAGDAMTGRLTLGNGIRGIAVQSGADMDDLVPDVSGGVNFWYCNTATTAGTVQNLPASGLFNLTAECPNANLVRQTVSFPLTGERYSRTRYQDAWSAWLPENIFINVKDFGAKGDGSADDTAAIQAALTKANGGGVVVVPQGTYKVTSRLQVGSNTQVIGLGKPIVRKAFGAKNATLLMNMLGYTPETHPGGSNGHSNILFRGIEFRGEYFNQVSAETAAAPYREYCLSFVNGQNIIVEDCIFNSWNHCHLVEFSGIRGGIVRNCKFHNLSMDEGAVAAGNAHPNEIIQLDPNTEASNAASAHDGTANTNILIEGCRFGTAGTVNRYGYAVGTHGSGGTYQGYITVRDNVIIGSCQYGLKLNNYHDVAVVSNTINATDYGIWVLKDADRNFIGLFVEGNTITASSPVYYNYSSAAALFRRHSIVNNHLISNGGVSYTQDVIGLRFTGNLCYGGQWSFNACQSAVISDNFFSSPVAVSLAAPVRIQSSASGNSPFNTVFSKNQVSNCGSNRGVLLKGGSQYHITDNILTYNTKYDSTKQSTPFWCEACTGVRFGMNYANFADTDYMFYAADSSVMLYDLGGNITANGAIKNQGA